MLQFLLTLLFVLILIAAAIAALGSFWRWFYHSPTSQNETHFFWTDDGWRLAVHRYRPNEKSRNHPVLLCHGLGSNRYAFDLPGAPSLARYLSQRGWDVWVAELRGSGMSGAPRLFRSDVPYSWGFDDHLEFDVPALIRQVLRVSGASKLHWVGHSMGGILIQAYLAACDDPPVMSATAVGSPVDFSAAKSTKLEAAFRLAALFGWSTIFLPALMWRFLSPFAYRIAAHTGLAFQARNVDPEVVRKFIALALQKVTPTRLWLELDRARRTGELGSGEAGSYPRRLPASRVPILYLAGSKDALIPVDSICPALESRAHAGPRRCIVLGCSSGCVDDYGHGDLLVGKRSETEVFSQIDHWMRENEPSLSGFQTEDTNSVRAASTNSHGVERHNER